MTIEVELKRIANALEALATSQGIVSGELPPDNHGEETKPAASKKTAKKTANKKVNKKTNKKTVGKKDDPADATDLTIKEDVRPVLKRLRDEVSHAAVKSLLKKYGASTIQQLDPKNFQRIIDDAIEDIGEPDPEDDGLGDDDDDL